MNNHKLILICTLALGLSMQSPAAAFWPTCPNFIHHIREVAIKHAAPAQNAIKNAVTHVVTNFPRLAKNAAIGLGVAVAVCTCFGVYGIIRMRPLQEALARSELRVNSLAAHNIRLENEKAAATVENTKLKHQNIGLSNLAQDYSKKLEQAEATCMAGESRYLELDATHKRMMQQSETMNSQLSRELKMLRRELEMKNKILAQQLPKMLQDPTDLNAEITHLKNEIKMKDDLQKCLAEFTMECIKSLAQAPAQINDTQKQARGYFSSMHIPRLWSST